MIIQLDLPRDYFPEEHCPEICTNHLHQHLEKELENSLRRRTRERAPVTRHYPWAYATPLTADFIRREIKDRHCTHQDYYDSIQQVVPEAKVQIQNQNRYPSPGEISSHLTPYGWIHFMPSAKSIGDLFRPGASLSSPSSGHLPFSGRLPAMVP